MQNFICVLMLNEAVMNCNWILIYLYENAQYLGNNFFDNLTVSTEQNVVHYMNNQCEIIYSLYIYHIC